MGKRICIIPCGAKKIWDVDPDAGERVAAEVYQSAFHKACRAYASTFFDEWYILSAKYGFLAPTDIVSGNYDVAFGTRNPEMIPDAALFENARSKNIVPDATLVVLGGKKFIQVLSKIQGPGQRIEYPLAECRGIGYMLQKLNRAIEEKKEISE